MTFSAGSPFDIHREARDWTALFARVAGSSHGPFHAILAPRRRGKTWALRALELQKEKAAFLDLRHQDSGSVDAKFLLLDEPANQLVDKSKALALLDGLRSLQSSGKTVVMAMTPDEWCQFKSHASSSLDDRDTFELKPLSLSEQACLARTQRAKNLLPHVCESWREHPFLLELIFELAERDTLDIYNQDNLKSLYREAIEVCAENGHRYCDNVFSKGMSHKQRQAIRRIAWCGTTEDSEETRHLIKMGVIRRTDEGSRLEIRDPVLRDYLPPALRIHHISDLHFGPKSASQGDVRCNDATAERIKTAIGAGPIVKDYQDHVVTAAHRGEGPHLVVVSGDLVETGTDEQYEQARAFLESLQKSLINHPDLSNENRILIVTGNHDVDWTKTIDGKKPHERHEKFASYFAAFPRPALEIPPDKRPLATCFHPDSSLEFVLLGSAELGGEIDGGIMKLMEENRLAVIAAKSSNSDSELRQTLKQMARIDPGLVHVKDIERLDRSRKGAKIRIAVLHHPISSLPEQEVGRYAGLLNAGHLKQALFKGGFALVLHGHAHVGWLSTEMTPSFSGRALNIACAPTLGSAEKNEANGFNEIVIRREGADYYEIEVTRFTRKGRSFQVEEKLPVFSALGLPCQSRLDEAVT